jgi:two-component system response regulator YesN
MVNEMLRYAHGNFEQNISMQDLAGLCHINQSYAGQLFRQEVGDTFNNYLTGIRIQRAAALLAGTDMSIANVAVAVGYNDYFYFAKVFKRVAGQTPTAYRRNPELVEMAVPAGGVALL